MYSWLFHLFRIFGHFPVFLKKDFSFSRSWPLILYSLAFLTAQVATPVHSYLVAFFNDPGAGDLFESKSRLEAILGMLDISSTCVTVISVVGNNLLKCDDIIKIFDLLLKSDKGDLCEVGILSFTLKNSAFLLLQLCFISSRYMLSSISNPTVVANDFTFFTLAISIQQYTLIILNVKHRLEKLNKNISKLFLMPVSVYSLSGIDTNEALLSLNRIASRYWQLCKIINFTNKAFGRQMLTMVFYLVVQLTLTLYHVYMAFTKIPIRYISVIRQFGFLTLFLVQLLFLTLPCNATTNLADKSLLKMSRYLQIKEGPIQKKVKQVLRNMEEPRTKFSIMNLIYIDNKLLTNAFSTVLLYWTIVTQFQNIYFKKMEEDEKHGRKEVL